MEQLDRLYKERYLEIQDGFDWSDAIEAAWPKIREALAAADALAEAVEDLGKFKEAVLSGKADGDGDLGERVLLKELRVGDAYLAYCTARGKDAHGFGCPYKVELR